MARFGKLMPYFASLYNNRNILSNRILSLQHQQVATLKAATIDKLKSLNIPEQPKRPLPPYIKFINEYRSKIKMEHPEWRMSEITKLCAKDWKDVDPIIKEKLTSDYHKELEVYAEKQVAYNEALTMEQIDALKEAQSEKQKSKQKRTTRKLQRQSDRPKRPLCNYLFFVKEKMALVENKGVKHSELIRICKEEWKVLTEQQKKKYTLLHESDKERYKVDMEKWELKMIREGKEDLIRKGTKITSTKAAKLPKSRNNQTEFEIN